MQIFFGPVGENKPGPGITKEEKPGPGMKNREFPIPVPKWTTLVISMIIILLFYFMITLD